MAGTDATPVELLAATMFSPSVKDPLGLLTVPPVEQSAARALHDAGTDVQAERTSGNVRQSEVSVHINRLTEVECRSCDTAASGGASVAVRLQIAGKVIGFIR